MLSYLKRRFSSTDLQEGGGPSGEITGSGSAGLQGRSSTVMTSGGAQQSVQDYQYLPPGASYPHEGTSKTSSATGVALRSGGGGGGGVGVTYPSAPNSPTRSSGFGFAGLGSITGQLSKTRQLFSTETLNSIIGDTKIAGLGNREKYKILLVIDHPATDWAKYLYKRRICVDWDVRVEQAQFSEISIATFADHDCVVTIQDSRAGRSFKPDFVLIRQGLGATPQHYENILTGLMFGGVQCINSIEATYAMKNRAWLFCYLLQIRKRLGASEFPLVVRSYQTKCQPITPDFQLPVNVRIGGDTTRECEVKAESISLFQSLMNLANTTQRYAITEPCINSVCDVYIQKIGHFFKAFTRKPMANPSLTAPASTILEKIPLTNKFTNWINEVSNLFGGLDMCAIKAIQDINGDYFIQEVYGSEFTLLGEGQEEDRMRTAELVLQKMENLIRKPISQKTQPLSCVTTGGVADASQTKVTPSAHQNQMLPDVPAQGAQMGRPSAQTPTSVTGPEQTQQTVPISMVHRGRVEVDPWTSTPAVVPVTNDFAGPQMSCSAQNLSSTMNRDALSGANTSSLKETRIPFDPFSAPPEPHKTTAVPNKSFDPFHPVTSTSSVDPFISGFGNSSTNYQKGSSTGDARPTKPLAKFGEQTAVGDITDDFSSLSLKSFETSTQQFGQLSKSKKEAILQNDPWGMPVQAQPPASRPHVPPRQTSVLSGAPTGSEDPDDTMKNLRKTFAGIFGDI